MCMLFSWTPQSWTDYDCSSVKEWKVNYKTVGITKHLSKLCAVKCVIEMVMYPFFSLLVGCIARVTAAQIQRLCSAPSASVMCGVIAKTCTLKVSLNCVIQEDYVKPRCVWCLDWCLGKIPSNKVILLSWAKQEKPWMFNVRIQKWAMCYEM